MRRAPTVVDGKLRDWLLEGDPSIRWQVMRDLLDAPVRRTQTERKRVGQTGWGRRLIDLQTDDGRWTTKRGPRGYRGLYIPKFTSTTYTLLLLRRMGLPGKHPAAVAGCRALVDGAQWFSDGSLALWNIPRTDTCVCGMVLSIFEAFDFGATDRREGLLRFLLDRQQGDGGWNCDPESEVSSMHTTVAVLEALGLCAENRPNGELAQPIGRGQEYLLERKLFRSKRTDKVIQAGFTRFSFPPRWRYDVLRALECLRASGCVVDARLEEAIALVNKKRLPDGTWPLQNRHSGESHFEMERVGKPSRWNTLRALRVLRWWNNM